MFSKLFAALFGRKEPEPQPTLAERMAELDRQEREALSRHRQPIGLGKHRTPPARRATESSSRPDDVLANPLHPANPIGLTSPASPYNGYSHEPAHTPSHSCSSSSSSSYSDSSSGSSCDSSSSSSSSSD